MPHRAILRIDKPLAEIGFWCPGCRSAHWVPTAGDRAWTWNGSLESPTLSPSPSLLRQGVHEEMGHQTVCHLFLRDGRIQYLADCQHALAGQTVDAPIVTDWPGPAVDG